MKKVFLLTLTAIFITACSSDDNDNSNESSSIDSQVQGVWVSTDWKETEKGTTNEGVEEKHIDKIISGEVVYEFKDDGELVSDFNAEKVKEITYENGEIVDEDVINNPENFTWNGDWEKDGDSIKIKMFEYEGNIKKSDISNGELKLEYSKHAGGGWYNYVEATLIKK